jgi:hypothetical protein
MKIVLNNIKQCTFGCKTYIYNIYPVIFPLILSNLKSKYTAGQKSQKLYERHSATDWPTQFYNFIIINF